MNFLGPSKDMRFQKGKGPSKDMRFLGPAKDMRFREGKHINGSIKAHEVLGPSNEMRFKFLYQNCLSPSMHMRIY